MYSWESTTAAKEGGGWVLGNGRTESPLLVPNPWGLIVDRVS